MTRIITVKLLREKGACEDHVELFAKTFPRGSRGSLRDCLKAARAGLDLEWAPEHLLDGPGWDAYQKACATARDAYLKALATALSKALREVQP